MFCMKWLVFLKYSQTCFTISGMLKFGVETPPVTNGIRVASLIDATLPKFHWSGASKNHHLLLYPVHPQPPTVWSHLLSNYHTDQLYQEITPLIVIKRTSPKSFSCDSFSAAIDWVDYVRITRKSNCFNCMVNLVFLKVINIKRLIQLVTWKTPDTKREIF